MTIIKITTKKGENLFTTGCNFNGYNLSECYGRYSRAKENAFNYCLELCEKENGKQFHICSHNTFGFSVAWYVENGMRIETAQNSYLILFPEYC